MRAAHSDSDVPEVILLNRQRGGDLFRLLVPASARVYCSARGRPCPYPVSREGTAGPTHRLPLQHGDLPSYLEDSTLGAADADSVQAICLQRWHLLSHSWARFIVPSEFLFKTAFHRVNSLAPALRLAGQVYSVSVSLWSLPVSLREFAPSQQFE